MPCGPKPASSRGSPFHSLGPTRKDSEQLWQMYGAEYPDAVHMFGMRMPLAKERRFTRTYTSKEHNHSTQVSRFVDGSASITLAELREQWSDWSETDKRD